MKFTKMHSLGNDFIIVENLDLDVSRFATNILNRYIGVGADYLIVVKRRPLEIKCYDAIGNEVNASCNAIRCFAKYAVSHMIVNGNSFEVITRLGKISVEIDSLVPFMCTVNMGKPNFNTKMCYVKDGINCFGRTINIDDYRVVIHSLFIGNVETVIFVDTLETSLTNIANKIANYNCFSRGTNINFVHVLDSKNIEVLSYIKDVGFVNSNSNGLCAAVVAGYKVGLTKNKVNVNVKYGSSVVEYTKKEYIYMSGDAHIIIEGDYKEE